jgi:hypothetical protein
MNDIPARRQQHTDRFYSLLDALAERVGGARLLLDCSAASGWPQHGVYFFFQDGETRTGGSRPRVVRVGTHALTATSRTTLWSRLAQHRGHISATNPGGGSQRGSVFRRHVGNALLASGAWPSEIAQSWPNNHVTSQQRQAERPLEVAVTAQIGAMPLLWLDVPDRARRHTIEANAIALLSRRTGGVDPPSAGWLGLHAANSKVRSSGLWNSNHVDDHYDPSFFDDMQICMNSHPQ